MAKRIETRVTQTIFAFETAFGVAPPTSAVWRPIDLNTYSDGGATYEVTPRSVMTGNRRVQKGAQTSRTAKFGYNIDNTIGNTVPQIAAFLYSQPREQPSSRSVVHGMPVAGLPDGAALSAVTATTVVTSAAVAATLAVNDIVIVEDGTNDRSAQVITAIDAAGTLTVAPVSKGTALVATAAANSAVRRVGMVISAESTVKLSDDKATAVLSSTGAGFDKKALSQGQWIFVGKDSDTAQTGNNAGFFARISGVGAESLALDTTTIAIGTTAGTDTNREVYFGTFIIDGDTAFSFTHSRYLGKSDGDDKDMREVTTGCLSSELALNINERTIVNMDLSYMAADSQYTKITADEEAAIKAATLPLTYGDSINTSTDIVRQRLSVPKVGLLNPAEIHSFVRESTLNITNNLQETTANGELGMIGADAGDFGLTGTIKTYFNSTAALDAVRCNCTVALDWILARKNQGIVIDVPALQLGADSISVEKGASIEISLTQTAFESSKYGYMLSYNVFHYLPDAAMPSHACDC